MIKNEKVRNRYQPKIQKIMNNTDQNTSTAEDQWQSFKGRIVTAGECIWRSRRAKIYEWFVNECQETTEKKNLERLARPTQGKKIQTTENDN